MAPPPITLWQRQSVPNSFGDFKTTLFSWDNCMNQAYCKWPVIIAIIVASCILLSLLTCLFRCLCCGAECCCACCPSRPRPRHDRDPRYNAPPPHPYPAPYTGYTPTPAPQPYPSPYNASPAPASYNVSPAPTPYNGYTPTPAPVYAPSPAPQPQPQFAAFDTHPGKTQGTGTGNIPLNEDALPPMPSWDTAPQRHVPDDGGRAEEHEMGPLSSSHETAPMLAHQAPSPLAAPSPYHTPNPSPSPYGAGAGAAEYGPAGAYAWGGGDYARSQPQQQGYAAYALSGVSAASSSRYEPSSAYAGQESGTVFRASSPPAQAPIGRKPVVNSWREV